MAVNRECNNVQHITLNVTVQPPFVRVIDENTKNTLSTGATLGPINEGSTISLYCESGEGKPVPTVEWFKDDQPLEATSSTTISDNGIGNSSSLLQMQITRDELDATFTCKVNSIALVEPLTVDVKLDVHVRPLKMDLNGVVGHVVQGTKILLQCTVRAARPAANVTWQNGTEYLNESNDRFEMFETKVQENEDGTSETISYLAFTATEYDNGRTFKCYAENSVTRSEDLKPMKESTTIEVLYPPIVTMQPENVTVNETEDFIIFCDYEANPASLTKVIWYRDDEELVLTDDHYEGGITEQTALTVKNATPSDMGSYRCTLYNNVGSSVSEDTVQVSVFYKPVVVVVMDPETPVNEADRLNVSLTCEVVSGNPASLTAVRWYLDGDLLKELPDCTRNSTATTTTTEESLIFCDIDPSKLLLEAVGRSFHGNYSCEGRNDAGWGPLSMSAPVVVHYKPGQASISYEPPQVIKKRPLTITCFVLDPGRPKVVGYKWFRGLHRLPDENDATLTIESVNLETEANFTCLAYNEAGDGDPATTFIDVSAAPAFIKKLLPYHGYVYNSPNVSIMCWVECAPICNISWLKGGVLMDFSKTNRYYLSNVIHPPDPRTNDFESIQSTLVWNLTAWPAGQLDRVEDNVQFTCESSSNGIGPGVKSSTHFHVEFPPENMTISKSMINVTVDTIPEMVTCNAKAHPEATFRWFREGSTDTIIEGRVLDLKIRVPKRSNGTYYCEAWNRHGRRNISMIMNVQFKPECHVEKERIDGVDYVVCSAVANPKETDFVWSLKSDNDTLEQVAEPRNGKSYIRIDTSVTNFRTYVCVANNSIGQSNPCEGNVPGHIPWWHELEGNLLLIVIVAAVVLILVIIIICVAIFIICRRKRNQMKYSNRVVELEEREHPDGGPPSPTVSSHSTQTTVQPTPAPRWPLKPGVLVHINRSHSLRSGLSVRTNETLRNELMARQNDEPMADRFLMETTITKVPGKVFRRRKENSQRSLTVSSLHDEGMLARANKIKAMFGVQLKEQSTLPGISREKTAVTYKRITPRQRILHAESSCELNRANVSRKRKKPGADPNQAANNNHVNSVSEGLPESGAKTFYENLPFHGIQAPPNKTLVLILPGRLAAQWFGTNELSTATSLGIFGNQLGIALSFLLTPMVVKNRANVEDIGDDLSRLFWTVAIIITVMFLLVVILFEENPKLPPSKTRAMQQLNQMEMDEGFIEPVKRLCKNKSYLLLCNSYGLSIGVLNVVGTLLNQMYLARFENGEEDAGRIGLVMTITGMIGSVSFGVLLDKTHKFKQTTVIVYFLSLCGQICFSIFTCLEMKWMVYLSAFLLGFSMVGYVTIGYEMSAEYTYPESEGITAGILNVANNVYGIVFVLIMGRVLEVYGDIPVHVGLCIALAVGLITTVFTKDEHRRQDAKNAQYTQVSQKEKNDCNGLEKN
nr:PREDICTED: titin [Megachile rotundata]